MAIVAYLWPSIEAGVGLFAALLPTLLIVQAALTLAFETARIGRFSDSDLQRQPKFERMMLSQVRPAYDLEVRNYQDSRRGRVLWWQYGLPAILLFTAVWIVYCAGFQQLCAGRPSDQPFTKGVRFGALGAYVYVLLALSRRTFARDVTPAAALWCATNMVLGAVLGGAIAYFWSGEAQATGLGEASVYFFAGFAPRYVMDRLGDAIQKMFLPPSDPDALVARNIPLTRVRGITPDIEDRLNEEGVSDVYTLATANPFRLIRRTPYDKRQIAAWIDEALLMVFVPQNWQILEKEGITGAIDFATFAPDETAAGIAPDPEIVALAQLIKTDPLLLRDLVKRVSEDAQVQMVWTLYQTMAADDA